MSQPGYPSPQPIVLFHPEFNRDVVPAVFSVEGIRFKVDVALLTGHSEVLRDMFGNAKDIGLPGKGTAEHPIVIPWCTAEAFLNFLRWLTHAPWEKTKDAEITAVLDILHISHTFEIQAGVDHAGDELDRLQIRPAQRLYLARRYGLIHWVGGAVRSLLTSPLSAMETADRNFLSAEALFLLTTTKEEIDQARRRLAIFPPRPPTDSAPHCDQHEECRRAFEERWLFIVTRRVLSTLNPILLTGIPALIRDTAIPGMTDGCKEYVAEWLAGSDRLTIEDDLVTAAIEKMEELCR